MAALTRFAPAAVLPDHEHVTIEQTYVLEGSDIQYRAGKVIWREAGSRHAAWCPKGALILATIQVSIDFLEGHGRVVLLAEGTTLGVILRCSAARAADLEKQAVDFAISGLAIFLRNGNYSQRRGL